jgi:hypothetical protein
MVQVLRVTGPAGARTLYLREGGLAAVRRNDRVVECVVRRLPDHDGSVLVTVGGREERVQVKDLLETT